MSNYLSVSFTETSMSVWHYLAISTAMWLVYQYWKPVPKVPGLPVINRAERWDFFSIKMKQRFLNHASSLMREGFEQSPRGFTIMSVNGPKLVLSPDYADEIKHDSRFSLEDAGLRDYPRSIDCLEPISGGNLQVLRGCIAKITRNLGNNSTCASMDGHKANVVGFKASLTAPLSDETSKSFQDHWTDNPDWHPVPLGSGLQRMVLRISGRAFLGPEVCGDTRWIDATMGYLEMGVRTAFVLQVFPRFLFPLQRWFPMCRKVRKHIDMAGTILRPVIDSRRADRRSAQDAISWFDEAAAGEAYNPVFSQLSLSFASTHTTADTMTKVIIHLAENPAVVSDLRKEVIEAIAKNDGLTKSALSQMNLLDSILKESQRLEPLASATMNRVTREGVTLSNGLWIPRNMYVLVSGHRMRDPTLYPDPEKFDAYRFVKMREVGERKSDCAYTAATVDHMGFGYGKHSCPGRFFAAHEVKIILCHLVLKYDIKLPEDQARTYLLAGFFTSAGPGNKLLVRRRVEEIAL